MLRNLRHGALRNQSTWPIPCVTLRNITQWLIPFLLEQRSQKRKEIWSSKTEPGGSSVFKCLLNSYFGLSNPSHILALGLPFPAPRLFAKHWFCVCTAAHNLKLPSQISLSAAISFLLGLQCPDSRICCRGFYPFPFFLMGEGIFPPLPLILWDLGMTSGSGILYPLFIYPWGGEYTFSAVITVIKAASL